MQKHVHTRKVKGGVVDLLAKKTVFNNMGVKMLFDTVKDKNMRLAAVLKGVEKLTFGEFEDNQIDLFGDAYEFLISNYAANAGKSGGEFFTPQHVSKLIAQL
jgi:type I restriction-modification system DNA methylase subunit